ncbi:MAG: MurT ligase domain-containing protein [Clostridiales bacterium]|nr:MurT ligase domain-containing protein [Clostridiales bacterium]
MKRLAAIWIGKLVFLVGKITHRRTSSSPGVMALKLCPSLISDMNNRVRKKIIVTCGTNGKTTTNNVIRSALESKGYKVMCNRIGANMLSGVATAYIEASDLLGRIDADYACLEIDEAYARIIFKQIKPHIMVITNLFRDQLDRYGEIEGTVKLIDDAIDLARGVTLVLNADDPVCSQFGARDDVKAIYYGVSEKVLDEEETIREGNLCPVCGTELSYNYHHYSQLGDFYCSQCSHKRRNPDYEIKDVELTQPLRFSINGEKIEVNYKGFYNILNLSAAYVALQAAGENTDNFVDILSNYKPQSGRMQEFKFNKPVVLSLSKNPAGFNQAITTVNSDTRKKDVIVAINDGVNDGEDVSWIWDVGFDKLKNENLKTLSVTGIRLYDIALRFKYADVAVDLVTDNMRDAIVSALKTESEIVYVMVNYTALYPTEEILKKLEKNYSDEVKEQ